MNKHKMAKIIYTTYQTNSFKKIKCTFIIDELTHAPVIFPISLGIFNCFENSDRAENFRQTVPIYGWWGGGAVAPRLNFRHCLLFTETIMVRYVYNNVPT